MGNKGGPISTKIYSKGDFIDILFAEFQTMVDRDTAVAQLRSAKLQRGAHTLWCTEDREPAMRAARNLCLGLKYILKQDMNITYNINVSDEAPYTVEVGGHLALTVNIVGAANERIWEKDWAEWADLQNNPKLQELLKKCDALLERASMGMKGGAKGTSKGSAGK